MGWRQTELSAFGSEVRWLGAEEAATAFRRADACLSRTHYGLSEAVFDRIDRLDVDDPGPEAVSWLADHIGRGNERLQLVFGRDEVGEVWAPFFLDHWQDLFGPSRDDVVILPVGGGWALFYCHEDEFEFGRTNPT